MAATTTWQFRGDHALNPHVLKLVQDKQHLGLHSLRMKPQRYSCDEGCGTLGGAWGVGGVVCEIGHGVPSQNLRMLDSQALQLQLVFD